ncbi:hypothetical protein KSP39_PZI010384 [Platanthera zijinensis]|uniref:FCP1 homology domain-containing protein n=1 Tax=Platanthera zijinensis TaxID=2320716 RepID=A0AAP0BKK7_9ASPA
MTKRRFSDVAGHQIEQHRSKRKEDDHSMYAVEVMEHNEANAMKNGCAASLNETHAESDSAGKSDEAPVMVSFSPQKEYHSIDSASYKEDGTFADKSTSSERNIVPSTTSSYLVTNVFPTPNLPQPNKMFISQVNQGCTAEDHASEPAHAATINEHLPSVIFPIEKVRLPENFNSVHQNNSCPEDFEKHDLKSVILKQYSTSMERRKDNLPENGSEGNVCRESSSVDVANCQSHSTENIAVAESTCADLSLKNAINGRKTSFPYLTERPSIQANVAEKDMVSMTLNYTSCSSEVLKNHMIDSMPLLAECGNSDNSGTRFRKMIQANASEKRKRSIHSIHEENISPCAYSSDISIEINQKVLSGNFKGDLSLPPSPITGVIDSFISKPYRQNNHLDLLNVEETAFSFQLPCKVFCKEIRKNDTSFVMQCGLGRVAESHGSKNQREDPSNVVSTGIHGDLVTQDRENVGSFSCSSTSKDDSNSKRRKIEVRELVPVLPERSLTCRRNRKKLLVLDLNGLLCDIVNDYTAPYRGEKRIGGKPIFKRPFCDDFLKFCFEKFDIGIWSSRRKYNVDSVLEYLMVEFKHKLLFCWDQSKCTYTGVRTLVNHHKPLVLKELKKLWDKEESDLPWQKGEFSPSNTLLLDDSPYKALFNPPHTAIFPYPYHHTDEDDKSLGPGGDIRVYLERLLIADDIQRYVEEHPFGQPAITDSDQHWNFYCEIIKSYATSSS